MSSVVSLYPPPPPIRSYLLKNPSEAIPPTEELEALHAELKMLREKTLERARKAGDDLRAIEESMRRMKEKEKGKAKALEKVKKERGFTPTLNGDDRRSSVQPGSSHKPRMPSVPVGSIASAASTPSYDPRKSMAKELKKKHDKKRKRDEISDVESEPAKVRKGSPLPPHTHPPSHPPKASKYPGSTTHAKSANLPDFSLPTPVSLVPLRPQPAPPPVPGPSKPTEVADDFSKTKASSQILIHTFYTSIEPWLRPIKEEDIGFLEYTGDEVEPFVMPKLGPHYSESWEREDIEHYGTLLPSTVALQTTLNHQPPNLTGQLPKWEPSTLTENDVMTEAHSHGPLNERLISALIPMIGSSEWKGVKAAEEAMEGRPGTNGAAAQAARDKLNVADLEDRIKNVLRFHGLLDEPPDFTEAVDDPIATALRHCQRELRTVMATNKARKARLAAIAKDRVAYQEYLDTKDCLDKTISTLYTKLQKKDGPKVNKKKKKASEPVGANGSVNGAGVPPPCPAALGLGPDEENRLVVPDQLKQYVAARRVFVDTIGGQFDEKEREHPGWLYGLPTKSVFEGIDEEVQRELEKVNGPPFNPSSAPKAGHIKEEPADSQRTLKGKGRAHDEMMELG
ncbi:NGG1 family protein [Abortiporus biennis]